MFPRRYAPREAFFTSRGHLGAGSYKFFGFTKGQWAAYPAFKELQDSVRDALNDNSRLVGPTVEWPPISARTIEDIASELVRELVSFASMWWGLTRPEAVQVTMPVPYHDVTVVTQSIMYVISCHIWIIPGLPN